MDAGHGATKRISPLKDEANDRGSKGLESKRAPRDTRTIPLGTDEE